MGFRLAIYVLYGWLEQLEQKKFRYIKMEYYDTALQFRNRQDSLFYL